MDVLTASRLTMAGLLLLGGVLAVLGGAVGSGQDVLEGAAQGLWLTGVTVALFGVGAGGYSLAVGAPYWLRLVASGGSAGLAAVVLTVAVPDLETGPTGAVVVGVVAALAGGWAYLVLRRASPGREKSLV